MVQVSVILACLFFSLRLVTVVERGKSGKANLLILPLLTLALFVSVHVLRIGFRDAVISNSFISQAASLALANALLFAAIKLPKAKWLISLMVLAAWVLINTHIVGFTWCAASMTLMAFGLPGASAKKRIAIAAAGAAIFSVFLVTAPGIKEVLRLSGTGGDLRGYEGQNLSDYVWIFTLFISLYALAIGAIVALCKRKTTLYEEFFWSAAGFLALGPLVLAAAATVFIKGGNWYPVMKWIYVYVPELLIVFVCIASRGPADSATAARPRPFFVLSLFIIAFLVQNPYLAPRVDLKPAILAEQGARHPAILGTRSYPGLHVDHPALNYFIARSILKIPVDGETFAWMGNGTMSEANLGPADFMAVAPRINPAESIQYRTGNSLAQRTLTNYWWPLELDHVWAARTPARIFFIAAKVPATIRIDFVPFMPNGPQLRKFGLIVNGTRMPEMTASAMDWSRPVSHSAEIPPGVIKQDGRVAITFIWDQIVKDDLGLALVAVEYK